MYGNMHKLFAIALVSSTLTVAQPNIYKLSKEITLETHNYKIFEKTYTDWCDNNEVWRDYERSKKGSYTQIMVSWNGKSSVPLKCADYTKCRRI